ncbi:MAG: DUF2671 domain-containing protein [Rickettsiales bacterium]
MRKLNLTAKRLTAVSAPRRNLDSDIMEPNMMLDPRYLRQSSSLIQDALQKGFDVLQLANGDIVTTGTKIVVHQYTWDDAKGKLVKAKTDSRKLRKAEGENEESDFDSDSERSGDSELRAETLAERILESEEY